MANIATCLETSGVLHALSVNLRPIIRPTSTSGDSFSIGVSDVFSGTAIELRKVAKALAGSAIWIVGEMDGRPHARN
jgi:hypothetical protein